MFDSAERDLRLYFRDRTLVFRLRQDRGHVLTLEVTPPPDGCRTLKARVRSVSAPADDRRLDLTLVAERKAGPPQGITVFLQPTRMNAVLWEGAEMAIRDALVPIDGWPSRSQGREGLVEPIPLERWGALMDEVAGDARALARRVAWTSPINAPALVAAGDPSAAHLLWLRIHAGEPIEPTLLRPTDSAPQPYAFPLPGVPSEPCDSLLTAMTESAGAEQAGSVALAHSPDTLAHLAREMKRRRRALGSIRRELEESPDPEGLRAIGDLILARFSDIRPGSSRASLTDFEGGTVEVALDPTMKPHENAETYYRRARRSARARELLPGRIDKAQAAIQDLESLRDRVRAGDVTRDEVEAILPAPTARSKQEGGGDGLPYRRLESSGGIEIRIGRGKRWNDDLTFRHSRPGDVWLHARHAAGAHVILRWEGEGAPPARDLEEAAIIAAANSKSRTSQTAAVDWTYRKYVRKPRGSPPGAVLPDRVKTLFVTPDAELEERLSGRS